jgi:aryl-alcohol dehydrogenase-like predicted oxidoreductase
MSEALPGTFVEGFHDPAEVRRMEFREMPHYGLVSIISFGASGLGGMFTAGKGSGLTDALADGSFDDPAVWFAEEAAEDIDQAREIVLACLKRGVNMIDSSHWYGQGRSERLLGHALADVPRAAYFLNTKIGRYEKATLGMFDFSYDKTYKAALDSLERLRIDCVDSMQVRAPPRQHSVQSLSEFSPSCRCTTPNLPRRWTSSSMRHCRRCSGSRTRARSGSSG